MGVCSQKSCCCVGAGLSLRLLSLQGFRTCCSSLWTCAPGAGHPLHEVSCTGNVCACTGFACFVVTIVSAVLEGVVILKGDSYSGFLHLLCIVFCCFHMSPNIWNTFDVPLGALILSPLILLK